MRGHNKAYYTMDIKMKVNIKALQDTIEISLISGMFALIADLGWLSHDVYENGFGVWYAFVGFGLLMALIGTIVALYRHHINFCIKRLYRRRPTAEVNAEEELTDIADIIGE